MGGWVGGRRRKSAAATLRLLLLLFTTPPFLLLSLSLSLPLLVNRLSMCVVCHPIKNGRFFPSQRRRSPSPPPPPPAAAFSIHLQNERSTILSMYSECNGMEKRKRKTTSSCVCVFWVCERREPTCCVGWWVGGWVEIHPHATQTTHRLQKKQAPTPHIRTHTHTHTRTWVGGWVGGWEGGQSKLLLATIKMVLTPPFLPYPPSHLPTHPLFPLLFFFFFVFFLPPSRLLMHNFH